MEDNRKTVTLQAAIKARCPRCAKGHLFAGPLTLKLRSRCENCGLDYSFIDTGDGPAVFGILILGSLVLGAALLVEFKLSPPIWVHVVLWGPVTLVLSLLVLRLLKSMLVALQFRHKAGEGRTEG